MFGPFRQVMTWLHTWFGLILGFVLLVVFFFGSLSVFNREIDRWAIPETRFESPGMPSFDATIKPLLEQLQPEAEELEAATERVGGTPRLSPIFWYWSGVSDRDPTLSLYGEFAVENPANPDDFVHGHAAADPRNGEFFSERLAIGSQWFYPLHFSLMLHWMNLGIWIVGVSSLMMLVALVTGVIIHKKIFREFFTFRPQKNSQRRTLDLHNLTGVVGLPFHFMFAFTGLFIFAGIYFPITETLLGDLHDQHEAAEEQRSGLTIQRSGVAAPLASVDAMVAEAKRRWAEQGGAKEPAWLSIRNPGDAGGYVTIYPATDDRLASNARALYFGASTGQVIYEDPLPSAIGRLSAYLIELHLMPFQHWLLRWMFFLGGLVSCVCISTGLLFFVGKRKQKHAAQGVNGARWVDALAVTTLTGTLIATTSMLVANRLLPADLAHRGEWEQRVFWFSWLLAFAHAAVRTAPVRSARLAPAWREQCYAVAVLATSAAGLNWITTGDHLWHTIGAGYWPVAATDLSLLGGAVIALVAAGRLRSQEAVTQTAAAAAKSKAKPPTAEVVHG